MPTMHTHTIDLPRLGERLLLARRRKGLSQGDLAKLAPCDVSLISRIERGVKPSLSVEVLGRLALALETSPNELLGWGQTHADVTEEAPGRGRRAGIWEGKVWISPDFDAPDEDIIRAFEGNATEGDATP